jgi:hypothetical protein
MTLYSEYVSAALNPKAWEEKYSSPTHAADFSCITWFSIFQSIVDNISISTAPGHVSPEAWVFTASAAG